MNWRSTFDTVILELMKYEYCKADAFYFRLEEKVQYLDLPYKDHIIIPAAVPFMGTHVGDLYILQSPGWLYIYSYLHKYKDTSSLLYPKEVNYDYVYAYSEFINIIKDKYDYLELITVYDILFPSYSKWLSYPHPCFTKKNGDIVSCFQGRFNLIHEINYFKYTLFDDLIKKVKKIQNSYQNDKIIQNYLIIQKKLPRYVNILQFLLLN